ncbi:MAG TPA: hypothetical protein PLL26_02800 [Candidatus Dojkabacteria bacterium]|nr:hypothetical protein [Candidatus Dojkabacteria bacterium]
MRLKLKVLDPLLPRLKYPEDDRWNIELEIEINEKLLLNLVDEIVEYVSENKLLESFNSKKWKEYISENDMDKMIKSARSWRRIQNYIQNEKCQTSRLTRISLFRQLIDIPNIQKQIDDRIECFQKS